jgi:hypothetical protein
MSLPSDVVTRLSSVVCDRCHTSDPHRAGNDKSESRAFLRAGERSRRLAVETHTLSQFARSFSPDDGGKSTERAKQASKAPMSLVAARKVNSENLQSAGTLGLINDGRLV